MYWLQKYKHSSDIINVHIHVCNFNKHFQKKKKKTLKKINYSLHSPKPKISGWYKERTEIQPFTT